MYNPKTMSKKYSTISKSTAFKIALQATTWNFQFVLILTAPVDKSSSVSRKQEIRMKSDPGNK